MSVLSIVASSGSVLTAALLVLIGSPAAAAETAPPLPIELVLHLPAGLSVEVLRAPGDHGSVTVAGCPADGALLLASTSQSPTGDGGVVEVPIELAVAQGSDDGPVAWQLRGISAWLAAHDPGPLSSVLLEASCMRSGNDTVRVTTVLPAVFTPLPIEVVLHLPAGLSVEVLRAPGDHGSVTVAGCPADGALLLASTSQSPTGDGGVVEVPIELAVAQGSDDGPVAWQLRGISAWLAAHDPGPLSSVLLEASCMRSGNDTVRVTTVLPPVFAPLQSMPPTTPATPVPEGGADPVTVPAASEPSAAPRMLAESGAPTPAVWPIVVGVLLILTGSAAVAVRGRRVH